MSKREQTHGEARLYFRPPVRPSAMDPFRSSFGEKRIEITAVKGWCPEDGGHEFESEGLNVFSSYDCACVEVECPIHGWKDANA